MTPVTILPLLPGKPHRLAGHLTDLSTSREGKWARSVSRGARNDEAPAPLRGVPAHRTGWTLERSECLVERRAWSHDSLGLSGVGTVVAPDVCGAALHRDEFGHDGFLTLSERGGEGSERSR